MTGEKSLFASSTFWGVAFNVALKVAGLWLAIDVDPAQVQTLAENTAAIVAFATSFGFDAYAIRGRVKAKSRIR